MLPGGSICTRWPFDDSPAHGLTLSSGTPASSCIDAAVKQPTCIHRPSILSHVLVARIFDSSVFAVAWLHMPVPSATILMPGNFAKTSFAASVRARSTEVPGTPVIITILPLPLMVLASHSAVTRPARCWSIATLCAHGSVTSPSYATTTTPFEQAFLIARFSAVGEIG